MQPLFAARLDADDREMVRMKPMSTTKIGTSTQKKCVVPVVFLAPANVRW